MTRMMMSEAIEKPTEVPVVNAYFVGDCFVERRCDRDALEDRRYNHGNAICSNECEKYDTSPSKPFDTVEYAQI